MILTSKCFQFLDGVFIKLAKLKAKILGALPIEIWRFGMKLVACLKAPAY